MVIFPLLLLLTGCNSGGSSNESTLRLKSHPEMTIDNVELAFSLNSAITPKIQGKLGTITYKLADNAANDVVKISADKRSLTILNAGSTEIIATDSGNQQYLPGSTNFTINIIEAPRSPLVVSDLTFTYDANGIVQASQAVDATTIIGEVTYQLAANQNTDVVQVQSSGEMLIVGTGTVQINITDNGGRNYQRAAKNFNVTIAEVSTTFAQFKSVTQPFIPGATFRPSYSGTPTQSIQYSLAEGAKTDVVRVDATNGKMWVVGAGKTTIKVQQNAPQYHEPVADQVFTVNISKAENLALSAQDLTLTYNDDVRPTLQVTNAKGELSFVLENGVGSDIIEIVDAQEGIIRPIGIGSVQVTIRDSGNKNFLAKTISTNVEVTRITEQSLKAVAIEERYHEGQTINPQVAGNHGQLTYVLTSVTPPGSISINPTTGVMTVSKPGTAQIVVTDDGGNFWSSQQKTFKVTINKKINSELGISNTSVEYVLGAQFTPIVLNSKGTPSFSIENPNNSTVFNQDNTGAIIINSIGTANLIIHDPGNDFFEPATKRVKVTVFSPRELSISNITTVYAEDQELPLLISDSSTTRLEVLQQDNDNVIEWLNNNTSVRIKNAGTASIRVRDPSSGKEANFDVTVTKAAENTALTLSAQMLETTFALPPNNTLRGPVVRGQIEGSQIRYENIDGAEIGIATIDRNSGRLSIKGAGLAKFRVIETSRNFEDTVRKFSVNVAKARHPGISVANVAVSTPFYPGRIIPPQPVNGQRGHLSYQLNGSSTGGNPISPDIGRIAPNGNVTVLRYLPNDGYIHITDDGGKNYKPSSNAYMLSTTTVEPNSGEIGNIDFTGLQPLVITSPEVVGSGDVSYFDLSYNDSLRQTSQPNGNDEEKGGYTSITLRVVKTDDPNKRGIIKLRLQKTSQCSDGSQIAYPINSQKIDTCPLPQAQPTNSQVSVIFNQEDNEAIFTNNNNVVPGEYSVLYPLVLIHYGRPYESGGIVESEDIQARAWWLINTRITKQ
jgi:hypothetical protein